MEHIVYNTKQSHSSQLVGECVRKMFMTRYVSIQVNNKKEAGKNGVKYQLGYRLIT